ncbi:histidine phosphatase family protein [Clostridium cellulovorans]|uniref:Phosphoglycerate mutase n=1 Tax=Clostridium cellulovorans (strain ATCC 35296 / DSM 3052 / OCM 3 / 743B) TaxID=573061 RepID=D9SPH2_CLOC7|nr:histidine phosphatase family protein [Clostridium cellulovorans]ADL50021.1 Phosphoglycerate mutase [Clostridium cellulovorans 743B]
MITNIYFVRHANSSYTPDELNRPLSENGVKDAQRVTELLSHENISKVISSPYKRAIQTVEGVSNHFGLSISIDEGFRERKLAEGAVTNFDEVILKYWENFDFCIHGGETAYDAQHRGVESLKNVLNRYCGENIVIGTHGNIMVIIMNYYDKKYNYVFWKDLNMPDIYKLIFKDNNLVGVEHIWS